ncbi:MAG: serine protease AprX [Thermoanaerobaculia bacterium]|nr:serine protease AprX [Thermoanaerobaculia bacterium]
MDGRVAGSFDPRVRSGSLSNSASLMIGASHDAIGNSYRGALDETMLVHRALDEAEVRTMQTATAAICHPNVLSIADSPVKVALIGTSYRVSLDGKSFGRPLPLKPSIELRYRPFDPLAGAPPDVPIALRQDDAEVSIVQFVTAPLEAYRVAIKSLGGTTYTFLPDQALITRLTPQARDAFRRQPYVRWIGPFHAAYKLEDPLRVRLSSGAGTSGRSARYSIQLLDRGNFSAPVIEKIKSLGGRMEMTNSRGFRIEATLTDAQLLAVARLWQVLFIDQWSPPQPDMDIVRQVGGANELTNVAGYSGQGVRGEVLDSGLLTTHHDFAAIPPLIHNGNSTDITHGTSVYGIVFGDGASDSQARGLLPLGQGILSSYHNLTDRYAHTAELIDGTKPYRTSFQTNSWGNGLTNAYTTFSSELDDILFLNDILVTQSQSNAGTTQSRPQAWAKNVLSVGGFNHFNTPTPLDDSWGGTGSIGPAADGRIKPDLSNFYDRTWTAYPSNDTGHADFGGTSGATPITAGHFGLFFEMWADGVFAGFPGTGLDVFNARPHATTAKAIMINTAWQHPFTGTGADFTRVHQGWGRADVGNMYELARKDRWRLPLVVDQTNVLAPFQTHSYTVQVPGNLADTLWLKATLVYSDPAGNPAASKHRVNDLSLRVTAPDGTVYWGNNGLNAAVWSTPGGSSNDLDTVENVFIPDGPSGAYNVEVLGDAIVQDAFPASPNIDAVYSLVVTRALGSCTAAPPNMVGWWPMDSATTTSVVDPIPEIQNGLNGHAIGTVALKPGEVKNAAVFGDSYIEVPDNPALNFGNAANGNFTIDAWYNQTGEGLGSDSDGRVVAQKLDVNTTTGSERGYSLFIQQSDGIDPTNFKLEIADGTPTVFASLVDAGLPGWHHIAVTVDRNSTTGGRWYLDGAELIGSRFDPTPRPGTLTNTATLKMGQLGSEMPWALDEVEIFNRALNAGEIQTIYEAGGQGKCKVDVWVEDTPWNDTSLAPDTGEEPDANMIGKPIWASRSMWVKSDGSPCVPGTFADHQNPEFGSPNKICVTVANRGERTAASTNVQVYWANASLGLAWAPGGGQWTLANSAMATNIAPHTQQVIELPWNTVPDPSTSTAGHFCLLARLVNVEDPMTTPETADIGANVVGNNNVAWRNVTVVDMQHKTSGGANVNVRNIKRGPELINLGFRGRNEFIADGGTLIIDLRQLFNTWKNGGGKGRNIAPLDGTRVRVQALPATIEGILMQPGEERVIALAVETKPPVPHEGATYRYIVEATESIRGKDIGGVSYVLVAQAKGMEQACPPGSPTNVIRGLHYPIKDFPTCAAAIADAESPASLISPLYRAACAASGTPPPAAKRAKVVSCVVAPPLSKDFIVVDVEVCCPPEVKK